MTTEENTATVLALARGMRFAPAQVQHLPALLASRDASGDDRRLCLECAHLQARQCRNPVRAGLARHSRSEYVGHDWVTLLQRCPGFAPHQH